MTPKTCLDCQAPLTCWRRKRCATCAPLAKRAYLQDYNRAYRARRTPEERAEECYVLRVKYREKHPPRPCSGCGTPLRISGMRECDACCSPRALYHRKWFRQKRAQLRATTSADGQPPLS